MSKQKAQKALEILQSDPTQPHYIVTFHPFSLFRDKEPRVYQASSKLQKFFIQPAMDCDRAFFFGDNQITFFHPNPKSFPAKVLRSDWGDQYFVEYSEGGDLGKRIKILSGKARAIVGGLATFLLFLITTFTNLKTEIIKLWPIKAPKEGPIELALRQAYYELPHPRPNGLFYWEYQQNCSVRKFRSGFSPTLKDSTFAGIYSRRTDEKGWAQVFEDHRSGNPSRIKSKDLPDGNALKNTMEELNVVEVISVPLPPDRCPKGYVSGGFSQELQDSSYRAFIAKLTRTAVKLTDFY